MKIALFGNPNTGKSSIFNLLTGLRQKVGNFPGVTVEKKIGELKLNSSSHTLIDFPGIYSLYPRSKDEEVVYDILKNNKDEHFPDLGIMVVDASNLERNLFLFSQLVDLEIPMILVLNMWDTAEKKGIKVDIEKLQKLFSNIPIIAMNARVGMGKKRLIDALTNALENPFSNELQFIPNYKLSALDEVDLQGQEANQRYHSIQNIVSEVVQVENTKTKISLLDKWLTHPVLGYAIFIIILFVIFQFVFTLAAYPMNWIDLGMHSLAIWVKSVLPSGIFSDLLSKGLIPGIGGVVIFIPQIALLFFFIAILEETGYLTRVVFIMDRILKPFGLNGRSVVPLLSSLACAIPGIMATRTIPDWKERTITLFVAPLMSCSARIPVFTLLISLVIPNKSIFGIIHLQGLVLFGLYILGIVSALIIAWLMKLCIKEKAESFLLLELPDYKAPIWKNVMFLVLEKVKVFTFEAGKVIVSISIVLWALASFGPSEKLAKAEKKLIHSEKYENSNFKTQKQMKASLKLENSYIGIFGKSFEPIIEPLGYNWKIGISLLTSFAAREVFVGSLATIYAVDETHDNMTLQKKMKTSLKPNGKPEYSLGTGVSLMVFYVYAMQCMSTLAVVRRETKSWRWPLIQTLVLGLLAYSMAWLSYTILG